VTDAERRLALEAIAAEVRSCTDCRLHEGRSRAVPGEGDPDTEVVFVGEGPGFNEDRLGRPFVGRAGDLLVKLLASIGWRREDVFITNVVKCRPPDNRDPEPDEIAACAKYLRRQLEVLDPAVVVTLGRHSMGRFMPGARISQAHGTVRPSDPATGAHSALVFAMYHPAAALRTPTIEQESYLDIAGVPAALLDSRRRREETAAEAGTAAAGAAAAEIAADAVEPVIEAEGVAGQSVATAELIEIGPDTVTVEPGALVPGPVEPGVAVDARAGGDATSTPLPDRASRGGDDAAPQLTLF
jgi:DNA polymerase